MSLFRRRSTRPAPSRLILAREHPESLESRVLLSTYYVSTSGSDGNPGSLDQPLRTIQQAASRAQPGDTVLVRGGTHPETVRPSRPRTASDRITLKPYGS